MKRGQRGGLPAEHLRARNSLPQRLDFGANGLDPWIRNTHEERIRDSIRSEGAGLTGPGALPSGAPDTRARGIDELPSVEGVPLSIKEGVEGQTVQDAMRDQDDLFAIHLRLQRAKEQVVEIL
jgi:hypothetical protein